MEGRQINRDVNEDKDTEAIVHFLIQIFLLLY